MKKLFSIVMVLVLSLALTSAVLADVPAPGGPFNSAFRVQNLETTPATCSYTFYDAAGAAAYNSASSTVQPGDSLFVYVGNLTLNTGSYSGVVSCDRKVAAVSNFGDADSGASYSGISEAGLEWYAPGVYDNYFNYYSDIVVQNASSAAVDITLNIYQPGNTTPVYTKTESGVPPSAAVSFEQEGLTELVTNQFYSAKITGTGNIAPVVNIYGKDAANNQLYSYNPFVSGSTEAFAPVIMNNYYGYNTALVIQNIGTASANVTVEYTNGNSSTHTIAQGAAESIYTPSSGKVNSGELVGAKVTSTNGQPIVLLVNESNNYGRAASYSGFSGASTEVRAPMAMVAYYGWNSSITCQNVGTAAATMTIAYATGASGTTTSPSIQPDKTQLFYQPGDPALASVPVNFLTSATITSAQPIVCVVNYDQNTGTNLTTTWDQLYSYNGIAP